MDAEGKSETLNRPELSRGTIMPAEPMAWMHARSVNVGASGEEQLTGAIRCPAKYFGLSVRSIVVLLVRLVAFFDGRVAVDWSLLLAGSVAQAFSRRLERFD